MQVPNPPKPSGLGRFLLIDAYGSCTPSASIVLRCCALDDVLYAILQDKLQSKPYGTHKLRWGSISLVGQHATGTAADRIHATCMHASGCMHKWRRHNRDELEVGVAACWHMLVAVLWSSSHDAGSTRLLCCCTTLLVAKRSKRQCASGTTPKKRIKLTCTSQQSGKSTSTAYTACIHRLQHIQ